VPSVRTHMAPTHASSAVADEIISKAQHVEAVAPLHGYALHRVSMSPYSACVNLLERSAAAMGAAYHVVQRGQTPFGIGSLAYRTQPDRGTADGAEPPTIFDQYGRRRSSHRRAALIPCRFPAGGEPACGGRKHAAAHSPVAPASISARASLLGKKYVSDSWVRVCNVIEKIPNHTFCYNPTLALCVRTPDGWQGLRACA